MTRFSKFLTMVAAVGSVAFLAGAASANMVTNPGFETGTFTGWNPWFYNGGNANLSDTWYVSNNPNDAHSGTYGAVTAFTVPTGTTTPTSYAGVYQNIPDASAAGEAFNASAWISTDAIDGYSEAYLQVQFQNSSGTVLQQIGTPFITGNNLPYAQYSLNNLVAPSGTTIIQIQGVIEGIGGLNATSSNTGYTRFDDFSLTPVPEPATIALMAIGFTGLALVSRRRRA